jgi:sarcosine oxidase gamma subunit
MTGGDRQLVREAVAAYFGGTLETADAGIYFQNGPLVSAGLGTAFPYKVNKSAPDQYYTWGMAPGTGWGAVMTVSLGRAAIVRMAEGGPTSGWRQRKYTTRCAFEVLSYEPHLETAEAGLDNLVDAWLDLLYLDRTLGTTSGIYPTGRLITQAGEGRTGIDVADPDEWVVLDERGKAAGGVAITFEALTMVEA